MKSHRILPAAVLLCTLAAACSETPTGTGPQAQPGGASYDGGGFTIGSGRSSESGGDTTSTGGTQDAGGFGIDSGSVESEDGETTTDRSGGFGMGSGR